MDDLRQRLLEKKLGDRLHWQKPEVVETIGPYDPAEFDRYEAQLAEAIDLLRERLEEYSDAQIAIIADEQSDDPDGLRKEWKLLPESGTDKRLRQPPPWYAGGFGHLDYRADFDYWSKMPSFSIPEITCLSVGIAPEKFDERLKAFSQERDRSELWPAVQYLLQRYDLLLRKFYSRVGSERFIIWAEQVDLEMPPQFRQKLLAYHAPPSLRTQESAKASKPDKREIDTIAQLFTAMAIDNYGYVPGQARSPIPREIADIAAGMGLQVSTETIRKYLKHGASFIPVDWQRE